MTSNEMSEEKNDPPVAEEADLPKPMIPLRQRKFPASFWQEPLTTPTPVLPPWVTYNRLPQFPQQMPWMHGFCSCTACLSYAYLYPHVYGTPVRYRAPYCPSTAAEQNCKVWHPDRSRQSRLRAARYNAFMD